jgi:hypothetical protein
MLMPVHRQALIRWLLFCETLLMKKIITTLLVILTLSSCDPFGFGDMPSSSEKELKENYSKKSKEITELKSFFNSITPKDLEVYIEYQSDKLIDLKVYYVKTPKYPVKTLFQQWNINPYNFNSQSSPLDSSDFAPETNSLDVVKKRLGWTDETFRMIKQYLDKANCISITNGNPANIGFRRSGMGMYFYNVFDQPLTDSLKKVYNDSCTYRLLNDTIALEYGGGAIGPQCFPDK